MKQTQLRLGWRLWLKWILLVSASAIASFAAALLSGHSSAAHIAGMICGIVTFIVIYTLIDGWADANAMARFRKSLRIGVLVKIALELIPAIEVGIGIMVVQVVESLGIKNVFSATYLKTIATGALLSCVVGLIACLYAYFSDRMRALPEAKAGNRA